MGTDYSVPGSKALISYKAAPRGQSGLSLFSTTS
jgi:hypothetical protein